MIIKIGHRGAKGYLPENTISSFKKALELNVDQIELDVHLCKSGEIIVMHDFTLNRTTNGKGYVKNKNIDEIKQLNAGLGEKIPLLEEVLDLVNKKVKVNIELKGKNTAIFVSKIIEKYVKKGWNYNHFIVSSFDHYQLKIIHKLNSKIKIGLLYNLFPINSIKLAKKLNAYSINVDYRFVTKYFINKAHLNGLKVFVYTVDDPKIIHKMKLLKVDGIFSNYPDLL
jgi:glycerophosphoryl diester phosphodiesterase